MRQYIEVWVCPECSNYYGASADEGKDLTRDMNYGRQEVSVDGQRVWMNVPTHNRARCPQCHAQRRRRRAFVLGVETTEEEMQLARALAVQLEEQRSHQ